MKTYEIADNTDEYHVLVADLIREGKPVGSRVGETLELEDVTISMHDTSRAMALARPGYRPLIGLAEAAQLVSGTLDVPLLEIAAPRIREFSDFHGAYGLRGGWQLPVLVDELRKPGSRRAVLALWSADLDARGEHTDHPCTVAITFRVRGGQLNMTAHMRSNDAWLGWPYDAVQFCVLQHTLANVLSVEPGSYVHHADSFHLYTRNLTAARRMLFDPLSYVDRIAANHAINGSLRLDGFGRRGCTLEDAQSEAVAAMSGEVSDESSRVARALASLASEGRAAKTAEDAEDAAIARARVAE